MPKKWEREAQRKKYEDHQRRIREMKPCVDDTAPKRMLLDSKKLNERDRYLAKVEKGNRLLLDRLGKAMLTKNIDNEMEKVTFISVGDENRKKILRKITVDNLRLLQRIRTAEPNYKSIEWERDAEEREQHLAILTEFPDMFERKYVPSQQMQRAKKKFLETIGARGPGSRAASATAAANENVENVNNSATTNSKPQRPHSHTGSSIPLQQQQSLQHQEHHNKVINKLTSRSILSSHHVTRGDRSDPNVYATSNLSHNRSIIPPSSAGASSSKSGNGGGGVGGVEYYYNNNPVNDEMLMSASFTSSSSARMPDAFSPPPQSSSSSTKHHHELYYSAKLGENMSMDHDFHTATVAACVAAAASDAAGGDGGDGNNNNVVTASATTAAAVSSPPPLSARSIRSNRSNRSNKSNGSGNFMSPLA